MSEYKSMTEMNGRLVHRIEWRGGEEPHHLQFLDTDGERLVLREEYLGDRSDLWISRQEFQIDKWVEVARYNTRFLSFIVWAGGEKQ